MAAKGTSREWFDKLIALPPHERERELALLSPDDPELAEKLRRQLAAAEDGGASIPPEVAAAGRQAASTGAGGLGAGDRVGPYVILGHLGDGGFGTVYKAERRRPHRQTVALKVVKAGVDTREVIARFSSERQALARMEHDHIAKVLDAGETDAGRPYFVMEYVPGVPITRFADEQKLSIEDRLALFRQVCDAIAHAHQKAIIHRDLKAANVLAYHHDGKATAKVIDFGIAKALTSDRLTDLTFNTAGGMVIGTYAAMSPEQAAGSPDIDTRTDVYSLGVLLYELLAGVAPFDPRELARSADDEVRRIIREVAPPAPSTRLTALDAAESAKLAQARNLRLDELSKRLRSELEWIPLMAMRKEPSRRYAGPLQLSEDIGRYLNGKPLVAGPESRAYRLKKYVRRNRGPLAAAASVLLALLLGLIGLAYGLDRARDQTRLAKAETIRAEGETQRAENAEADAIEQRDEANRQKEEAERQASITKETNDFLFGMFDSANPTNARGEAVTVAKVVNLAVDELDGRFNDRPLVKAALQDSLANVLCSLGLFSAAEPLSREALAARRRVLGGDHPDTLASINNLAALLDLEGDYAVAEPLYREALDGGRKVLGDDHPDTLGWINNLACLLVSRGDYDEAESLHREALAGRRRVLGNDHLDTLTSTNNLAALLYYRGNFDAAEPLLREALAISRRVLGGDHPNTLGSIDNLASLIRSRGDYDASESLYREALAGRRRVLGDDHPDTLTSAHNLAALLKARGKYEAAEPLVREALAGRRRVLGDDHPETLVSVSNFAALLKARGEYEAAEPYFREALAGRRRVLGDDHPDTLTSVNNLASLLYSRGDYKAAEPLYREAFDGLRRVLGDSHPNTITVAKSWMQFLHEQGRTAEAEAVRAELGLEPPATRPATSPATQPATRSSDEPATRATGG